MYNKMGIFRLFPKLFLDYASYAEVMQPQISGPKVKGNVWTYGTGDCSKLHSFELYNL
jgi:hypothetical protein